MRKFRAGDVVEDKRAEGYTLGRGKIVEATARGYTVTFFNPDIGKVRNVPTRVLRLVHSIEESRAAKIDSKE